MHAAPIKKTEPATPEPAAEPERRSDDAQPAAASVGPLLPALFGLASALPPDPAQRSASPAHSPARAAQTLQAPVLFGLAHPIQAKLAVGKPDDPAEREADRMATYVTAVPGPQVQRMCACGGNAGPDGECATCKAHRLSIQRRASAPTTPAVAPASVGSALQSGGRPLEPAVRSYMEPRFGVDLGHVRVHTEPQAGASAADIHALAYTYGSHIVFAPSQYEPSSPAGQRLLAHELAHVMQQSTGKALVRRQPATSPAGPRGPNPALCMTSICNALARPSATCLSDPHACAQTWIGDVMSCLSAGAQASNASNFQAILDNTRQELSDEVSYMNSQQPVTNAGNRRDYLDWLRRVCLRKQREIEIEFRFNAVFENVPGQTPWAFERSDWDEIETALEEVPDEHLGSRASGPRLTTFRRERAGPPMPGGVVGGETSPSSGQIKIYDAGIGTAPFSRSQSLGLPATSQTLRHEIGHIVDALIPQAELQAFFEQVVDWYDYSWAWITAPVPRYPNWQQERDRLCRALGFTNAQGQCDDARLDPWLATFQSGNTVTQGGRMYSRAAQGNFLTSWRAGNVPSGREFEYARTARGEYFAEMYTFAISAPEFLHDQLPRQQIDWLKEHVFSTQSHYDELIRPLERLAVGGSRASEAELLTLLMRARRQFTRRQIQRVAQQIQTWLQGLPAQLHGERLVEASTPATETGESDTTVSEATTPATLQAKLAVGRSDDPAEIEADQIAEAITQQSAPQMRHQASPITTFDAAAATISASVAAATQTPGHALAPGLRSYIEPRFGVDFGGVRLHTSEQAGQSAQDLGALAYTYHDHIVFAPGQYRPENQAGLQLLAHELAHVVQQSAAAPRGLAPAARHANAGTPLIQRQSAPIGSLTVPDDMRPDPAIDIAEARDRNPYWWQRLALADLHLLRNYDPTNHPVAYANRTVELQRLLRTRSLDRRTIGDRLDRDGVFGPRTFMALRRLALDPDTYREVYPDIQGIGFRVEALSTDSRAATDPAVRAYVELHRAQFIAQWAVSASSEAVLRFYRTNFLMNIQDRDALDQLLFPQGNAPTDFSRDEHLELMSRIYTGMTFSGTAALITLDRSYIHIFDSQRAFERDRHRPRNATYFYFSSKRGDATRQMFETLGLQIPAGRHAREIHAQLDAQQGQAPDRTMAGMLALYYLPPIPDQLRTQVVDEVLRAREIHHQQIEADNREAVRQRVNQLLMLTAEDRNRMTWWLDTQNLLREFIGMPPIFEMFLDELRAREGNQFDRVITLIEDLHQFSTLALLVRLCLETRYRSDPRVVTAVRRLNALRQGGMEHQYIDGEHPAVIIDGRHRLEINQEAGEVSHLYLRDDNIQKLKPTTQHRLEVELMRQAILHSGHVIGGQDSAQYTQEAFCEMLTREAIHAIGGIQKDDIETVNHEETVRLLGVRRRTEQGVERAEIEYVIVTRDDGGAWQVVPGTRGWRSDAEFEYQLFMYRLSQEMDLFETAMLAITVVGVALAAWEVGLLAYLIELGGGPIAVGVSVGISLAIYALTADHLTLEGFIVAGIQGYLAAVGFKFFAPVGGIVARWIVPATVTEAAFLRVAAAWILSRAAVGGLTGVIGGPLALFVDDLARILTHGGGFSSLRSYLTSAAYGFVCGIGFELAGSMLLAPLFRAGGRTALQTIEEVVQELRQNRITPTQWIAESTGALGRLRTFLITNLDGDIAQQMQRIFAEKFEQVTANYVSGLRLTIFRQVFELAEIDLSRDAVQGLERMLTASASHLTNDAIVSLLRNVAQNPARTSVFLSVLHAADDHLMEHIVASGKLRALSEAEGLLALGATRPAHEIAGLLRRFNISVENAETFAQQLNGLREDLRGSVLDALRDRGVAVTPTSLLRVAESATPLSQEVLSGLERLVRGATDVHGLETLLNTIPNARVGDLLQFARTVSDPDLAHLLALADDPARGARLLAYADTSAQLASMMQIAHQNLGELDALFARTTARGPAGRNPAVLEALLNEPGSSFANIQLRVNQIDGDAALLQRTIQRIGTRTQVEGVLNIAQTHASTADPAAVRRFFEVAEQHTFNDVANMREFLSRVRLSQTSPAKMDLAAATEALDSFATHHTHSTAAPPLPPGHGPQNLAAPTSSVRLTRTDGTTIDILFTNETLQHVQEGHTFEHFWFDTAKIDRAGKSTFYPAGTGSAQIIDDALACIRTPKFLAQLEIALAAGDDFVRPPTIDVGGTKFAIGVQLPEAITRMFYPDTGTQALAVQRHILHGIKAMLKL